MPIRWYGTGDPNDPIYRHFSRIVNLTIHAMFFAALNSGLWFFQKINHPWSHLNWFTEVWLGFLLVHLFVVISLRPPISEVSSEANESSP